MHWMLVFPYWQQILWNLLNVPFTCTADGVENEYLLFLIALVDFCWQVCKTNAFGLVIWMDKSVTPYDRHIDFQGQKLLLNFLCEFSLQSCKPSNWMFGKAKIKVLYITLLGLLKFVYNKVLHLLPFHVELSSQLWMLSEATIFRYWSVLLDGCLRQACSTRVFGHPIRAAACKGTVPRSAVQCWIMQLSPVVSFTLVHVLPCRFILRNNGTGFLQSVLRFFLIYQPDFSAQTVRMHYLLTFILFSSEDPGSIHHIWTNVLLPSWDKLS